jgi:SNF2 family DNA or RNA helicase
VWPAEITKWADFVDLKIQVLHGAEKVWRASQPADIYVLNYEGLDWFLENTGTVAYRTCKTLIADESTRLKNSQSKRFKKLKQHLNNFDRRWILTGTPAANGLQDLWAQIYLLDGGLALGRFITHFRTRYYDPPDYGGFEYRIRAGSAEDIYDKIKPYVLRMAAEDYLEMPELVHNNIPVVLPPAARKIYNNIYDNFITLISEQYVTAANAAVAGNKCLQVCNGALYTAAPEFETIHEAKVDALEDLLEELSGKPALVFYQYNHDLDRIQKRLGGTATVLSGLNGTALVATVNAFNAGRIPVLLAHPASAGHGLNLQDVANHVIWFGLPWSLELYHQAIDRVWRQGNPNSHVFIHNILAEDTIDEKVQRTLAGKDRTQAALFRALLS